MAAQQKLGILSQRRAWAHPFDRGHSDAYGKDLKLCLQAASIWPPAQHLTSFSEICKNFEGHHEHTTVDRSKPAIPDENA
jgi:hypothetical protein